MAVTLLFVALRLYFPPKADVPTPHRGLGWLLGLRGTGGRPTAPTALAAATEVQREWLGV